MFAEDTELFKEIKSSNDTPALQENPTNLESWFIPFDASLKKSKCHSHQISHETKPTINVYHMNGFILESINVLK